MPVTTRRPLIRFALAMFSGHREIRAFRDPFDDDVPALLVSLPYVQKFCETQRYFHFSDWALDSGAFSAHVSAARGVTVAQYLDVARELRAADPRLTEIYSLDVIGSWRQTLAHTEQLWRGGIEAIPCFHHGEPWDVLRGYARDYPKVALGGVAGLPPTKLTWARTCFDLIWPARVHGFAFAGRRALLTLPFDSVDASNWLTPIRYGAWRSLGSVQRQMVKGASVGRTQNLRAEVECYLRLEREARARWAQTWYQVDQ
jgi:hypothetical protein